MDHGNHYPVKGIIAQCPKRGVVGSR